MLISPPSTIIFGRFKCCMPPLGLGYLAAILEENGYGVEILDCALEGFNNEIKENEYLTFGLSCREIERRIKEYSPNLVGISCLFSIAINNVLKVAEIVKGININIPVVLGGHHPSALAGEVLRNKSIDYVVIGEGESSFLDLVIKIHNNDEGSVRQSDGTAYRGREGSVCINPKTEFIDNLDELPIPAWHLFKMEEYFKIRLSHNPFTAGKRVVPLITSRGCPFHCIFCAAANLWGSRFRGRSVKYILNEISFLKERYGIDEIQFEDDNMTWNKQRAIELFDGMVERNFNIHWCVPQGIRVDTLDENICRKMKESGCYEVSIGIESGNQEVLDKIVKKNLRLEKVYDSVKWFRKYGIRTNGFFIVGIPGETIENMKETCRLARKLRLNTSFVFAVSPLVGTELYEICRNKNYLTRDFNASKADYSFSCITTEDFSAEEVTRLVAQQQIWLNLILPSLRSPLPFFRRFFLFFLQRPAEALKFINLFLQNMFKNK